MSLDLKKFQQSLPQFSHSLWELLLPMGFVPTIVGGVVRDFILTGKVGKDWDIELSHQSLSWDLNYWKDLGRSLSKLGKVSFLPYDVIRLDIQSYQVEFSPPRIETFSEAQSHKNFTVSFDYRLPYEEAIRRRDFTINTMGIRFHTEKKLEFLDPLDGVFHLRDHLLHPAGMDFKKDPVRFLRAIRFMTKYSLTPSSELQEALETMNASGFTSTYLWNEMQKSGSPLKFYRSLLQWSDKHPELKLPLKDADSLKWEALDKVLSDPSRHESWMVGLEWVGLSGEDWGQYFSLSLESARRLSRWAQTSKQFKNIQPESFHGEFEEVREQKDFLLLFDWYFTTKQLLQKHPELPLIKMIGEYLPDWVHLYRFEPVKDVKHIDPPLRAKYQVWNLCQRL